MSGTEWQLFVSLAIVAGAAWYVGRSFWNSAHPKKGACGGCGCKSSPAAKEPQGQLISSGIDHTAASPGGKRARDELVLWNSVGKRCCLVFGILAKSATESRPTSVGSWRYWR